MATGFVQAGWTVGIHGRDSGAVDNLVRQFGPPTLGFAFDVKDTSNMMSALSTFTHAAGALDCVVHCAGIMKDSPLGMISQELASEVVGVNVLSTIQLVQFSSRIMSRKNRGSIILFNSVVGLDGALGQTLYSASKAALLGLVKSAARELGPKGIRINAIAPGLIETDLIKNLDRDLLSDLQKEIPLRRFGETSDIVPLVMLLAGENGAYITGETIRIDGGFRP